MAQLRGTGEKGPGQQLGGGEEWAGREGRRDERKEKGSVRPMCNQRIKTEAGRVEIRKKPAFVDT